MNTKDFEHILDELVRRRSQLLGRAFHGVKPDDAVGADGVPDFADYAADKAETGVADKIAGSEAKLLEKVELALSRLEEGTYDRCAECGAEIPIERLMAKTTVSLCVGCQAQKEAALA